ncbi:MAG TPA: hypothetical protein VM513_14925 [Kofleriaceae bacterium]|jgi:hypothetical protein|nr:hypothetical protein [Kofleriaceae bacterium]
MRPRSLVVAVVVITAACGSRGGGDDEPSMYESIEIEPALATLSLPLGGSATQAYTVYGVANGYAKQDITARCSLAIDAAFGTFTDATVTVQGRGGKTPIIAACGDGLAGQAQLVVNLTGSVTVGTGAPANSAELFTAAIAGTDATRTPMIEYPIDRAVSPRNIPPVETQWSAAGNDLYHLRIASGFIAVDVYSATPEAMLSADAWHAIAETAAGDNLTFTVEGLLQADPATKFASTSTTIKMSTDTIDQTAIYYWASDQGNVMSQTFGAVTPPSVVKDNCTSCHSVSRAGTRVGYSRCVGDCSSPNVRVGFLKFDPATKLWNEAVDASTVGINGSYTTFAPVGNPFPDDTQALAMLTLAGGTLALYDPDTGTPIASNLTVANFDDAARSALMPDWSPDGNTVVYTSASPGQWIDLTDGKIATMSYSYAGGVHTFGTPQLIVSDPIALSNGTYNNFFFPSFSPDNNLVVFNAARAQWRSTETYARDPGQRLMLTTPTGAWKQDLTAANGGFVDSDITWAHWAPSVSSEYYWIVFSSERDYGHRTTQATSPAACKQNKVQQCKQIWLTAIARNKLDGTVDPSAPPMWLPGQDPLANNISPYWSRPALIQ